MITNSWLRVTALAAALVAVLAALGIITLTYKPIIQPVLSVLLPFSIAVAIALFLDPTISRLEARGLARGWSVAIIAVLFLAAVGLFGVFIVPAVAGQATELASNLPGYYQQGQRALETFTNSHQGLLKRFHLPTTAQAITTEVSNRAQTAITKSFSGLASTLAGLIGKAVWLVLIPIIAVFLLADINKIKQKSLLVFPEPYRERTAELAGSVGGLFGAYMRGLLSVAFLYGIACGVALGLWGVPYAVLLGTVAGALSLVPYVGTITTLLLVSLIAFVSNTGDPIIAAWVAVTILVLNQVFDNAVTPRIVGKAVGIHPALAILALLIGGQMFGLMGMILAVPIAASIQLLVLEFYPPLRGTEDAVVEAPKPPLFSRIFHKFHSRA